MNCTWYSVIFCYFWQIYLRFPFPWGGSNCKFRISAAARHSRTLMLGTLNSVWQLNVSFEIMIYLLLAFSHFPAFPRCLAKHYYGSSLVTDSGCRRLWSTADRTCIIPYTHNTFVDKNFVSRCGTVLLTTGHQLWTSQMVTQKHFRLAVNLPRYCDWLLICTLSK